MVFLTKPAAVISVQDGGSLDQVLKEAKRIPEDILGKVSIAVSSLAAAPPWDIMSHPHLLEILCQPHHGLCVACEHSFLPHIKMTVWGLGI